MTSNRRSSLILLAGALALAACGGSDSSSDSSQNPPGGATGATRGAITARDATSITVNGVRLSKQGAVVTDDTQVVADDRLTRGTVVTVRGTFDDRTGTATEIELEHGLEGRIDDKGTDFVRVGGQVVRVDDTTEFGEDNPARLGSLAVGNVIVVSGVPDDKGGLRASRIDDSPRNGGVSSDDDDFDVKGFVSNLSGSTFELRISPDSVAYWVVNASGITLPAGLSNGAYVEVHTLSTPAAGTAPVLGTITASRIEIEDRFGRSEVEVEGIVTSGSSAQFVVDGVTVRTSASTRWELGAPGDLIPGVKVEVEGSLVSGVLEAHKVSFRPGARITSWIESVDATSITVLGVRVQTPSFMDNDFGALVAGAKVEVRGNPAANGTDLVAYRVTDPSGNADRVFIRAVVTAKAQSPMTFTVMGFQVTTAGAEFRRSSGSSGVDGPPMSATEFYDAVEPGHTVIKVRAGTLGDVNVPGKVFAAEELELEGNDD